MILRVIIKVIWILLGSLSFIGGLIGMLLPIVPQVPFFLLTIWCITKISPRFHDWLLTNRLYLKYAAPLVRRLEKLKPQKRTAIKEIEK